MFTESKRVTFVDEFNKKTYTNDFMIKDFTWEELKLLRRKQRYSETRLSTFDGQYPMMSLQEVINLVRELNHR